jgi:uncharacterized membrane protein
MSDKTVHVIVAAFHDENSAVAAYRELKDKKNLRLIHMKNSAVVRKDEEGKLHVKETHDMGGGKGAGIGLLVGGAIGLLSGGVGILGAGAVGAVVGGLAAKLHDGGFKDDQLTEIGESLQPGTSALVAVVEEDELAEVRGHLTEDARHVMVTNLSPGIAAQLVEEDSNFDDEVAETAE